MKTCLFVLLCLTLSSAQPPTDPVSPNQPSPTSQPTSQPVPIPANDDTALRANLGKPAVVTGTVRSAKLSNTGKVFRIEFKDATNSKFNAVIFERNLKLISQSLGSDLSASLTDKTIEITGTIEEYRGSPQIILSRPEQIKILP